MSNGDMPAGHRRGAARGAAARAAVIVRVAGAAVHRVAALIVRQELGDVGAAEQDRAGGAQAPHHRTVALRPVVGERLRPHGGQDAGDFVAVLERKRHTVQRPPDFAARERRVGLARTLSRAIEVERDHGVEARIALRDALRVQVERFQRGALALADRACDRQQGCVGQVGHRVLPLAASLSSSCRRPGRAT
jgi:hypothetical protein